MSKPARRSWIHGEHEFLAFLVDFLDGLEDEAETFETALHDAIAALENYPWDGSLPVLPHGKGGSKFALPLTEKYLLVFRRRTDRDGSGRPLRIHLDLIAIELKPGG